MTKKGNVFFVLYLDQIYGALQHFRKERAKAKTISERGSCNGYVQALESILLLGETNEYPEEWDTLNTLVPLASTKSR